MGFLEYVELTDKVMDLHTKIENNPFEFSEESHAFIDDMFVTVASGDSLSNDSCERIESMWLSYIQLT